MQNKYIDLRQKLSVGEMISFYFDFFKQNYKGFTNIFISYNGIFMLLLLGVSYMLVSGFLGVFNNTTPFSSSDEANSTMLIGFGALVLMLVLILVAALNYSLTSVYMSKYVNQKGGEIEKKGVWNTVVNNFGKIIVFILLLFLIYIGFVILSVILAFIPLIGTIVQYIISFAMGSWFGISFMIMLHEGKSVSDSFGEGWSLVIKNFWKCVGTNFIISLMVGVLMLLLLSIPSVLIGIYAFHAVDTGVDLSDSIIAKIIWTIALCMFLIVLTYSQALSQFANGILYFSLHEQTYNENTREKIEQIGAEE